MPDSPPEPVFRERPVSFVVRSGRMSDGQERAWAAYSDVYLLEVPRGNAVWSVRAGSAIDPAVVWGREAPLIVEIGSGQGHQIIHASSSRPDVDFLAVEVFRAGLARTMRDAAEAGAQNLRLVEANAPEVLEHLLPAASVDELWVFFPDPWHKSKHNKRRLIDEEFAAIAARAVKDGGMLRLATDWEHYARQMRTVLDDAPGFDRAFEGDWAERFDGRVLTAFEQKGARVGRSIRDLAYRRTTGADA
ncbi:tRNA (guanosine(46)-N7)-methyltransferase TrmB [Microbacterium sp. P07]|uniref:tRNA (guanosine(46)-N7)-methyltransferase TrmB n=1 Tax=Microbacterium sp. P07 TaxID=3366952 RepID=UPI0037456FBA